MDPLLDLASLQDRILAAFSSSDASSVLFDTRAFGKSLLESVAAAARRTSPTDPEVQLPDGVVLRLSQFAAIFPQADNLLSFWRRGLEDLSHLLTPWKTGDFEAAWKDFWAEERWKEALGIVVQFGGQQALLAVSLITTARHYTNLVSHASLLSNAYNAYFFAEKGFQAVDGTAVPRPAFPSLDLSDQDAAKQLKGYFGLQTGERYLRDLVRITVEIGGDVQFRLRQRVPALAQGADLDEAQRKVAQQWLVGFASMAEGLVMSSVEQVTQGVGSFRTNPLIAAAASTLAAVAARKATQHAFLWELGIRPV